MLDLQMKEVNLPKLRGLAAWLPTQTPVWYCADRNIITEGFFGVDRFGKLTTQMFLCYLEDNYIEYLELENEMLERMLEYASTR